MTGILLLRGDVRSGFGGGSERELEDGGTLIWRCTVADLVA